jgi:hypothetical protein
MSRVWGRPASDSPIGTSYTEEEFKRAAARFNSTGTPEIACFFKDIPLDVLADPGPQLKEVLRFRQSMEGSHQVLYRSFASAEAFAKYLSDYLQMYSAGKLPVQRSVRRQVLVSVPDDVGSAPDDWRAAETLTQQAIFAAQAGRMDEASVLFAAVAQQTTDIRLLAVAEDFFRQRSELVTALAIADRRLVLTRDRRRAAMEYIATMPSLPEEVAANALPHLPPESHAMFLEVIDEVFGSPAFKDEMIGYLAEHMTVPELLSLARFYRGEGKNVAAKAGRYMGDAIPRAIDQVNERLRARGLLD